MNEYESILNVVFPKNTKIVGVSNNSKKIKKDFIFFALPGSQNHGSNYIEEAIELGASVIVHNDPDYKSERSNIFFIKDLYIKSGSSKHLKFLEKFYSSINFCCKDSKIKFIGFTGTNGKTTTANLCHQILCQHGNESLYIGTLGAQRKTSKFNTNFFKKTTPDIFELYETLNFYKFFKGYVCIEISSHALHQDRLNGLRLEYASIINFNEDHLDYHKTIKEYAQSKLKIFEMLINKENFHIDDDAINLINFFKKSNTLNKFQTFDEIKKNHLLSTNNINVLDKISYFKIFELSYSTNLFPAFNVKNLMSALMPIVKGNITRFNKETTNKLNYLRLPKGRCELIDNIPVNVIIDYAHNHGAFETLLLSIKNYYKNLIVIFGCGGDRDKLKRSKMLRSAITHCRLVIFTSDNSRYETFEDIYRDASIGNSNQKVKVIEDRKLAIEEGIKILKKHECLLILGKGHETYQETKGKKYKFSDHEVINEIYK